MAECLAVVGEALRRGNGVPPPSTEDWLVGQGVALGMLDATPPHGHCADAKLKLLADGSYELAVGTAEFGNGSTTVHRQIAAAVLGTVVDRIHIVQADTDCVGLGAAMYESLVLDESGRVTTRTLRNYHIPAFGDVPRTDVHFADTSDSIGPLGAKSMSESPLLPVAPALANAVRDATGIRFSTLPLARDHVHLTIVADRCRAHVTPPTPITCPGSGVRPAPQPPP